MFCAGTGREESGEKVSPVKEGWENRGFPSAVTRTKSSYLSTKCQKSSIV